MLKKLVLLRRCWPLCMSLTAMVRSGFQQRIVRERQYRYVCQRSFWGDGLRRQGDPVRADRRQSSTTGSDGKALFQILTPGLLYSQDRENRI